MVDLGDFRSIFSGRLLTDADKTAAFLTDWRQIWHGKAIAVAQPDTVEDVARIVRWAAHHHIPIVTQGGNTGMSGGAIPDDSGTALLLSTTRLNRIREIDATNNSMTVDAGCLLHSVQQAAEAAGKLFPLSLAAEGSCTIGGNLATNAGGVAVLRYGNMRDLCLGIEVVLADGQVWNGLRALRKDNSGYALRDLFIGSEGTLGIITGAVLKLFPRPLERVTAWVALDSPAQGLELLERLRERLDSALTGFELISDAALDLVLEHAPRTRRPVGSPAGWHVLIDISVHDCSGGAAAALDAVLEAGFEGGAIRDAAIAQSGAQATELWSLRERIGEAQSAAGKVIKHDISVPVSRVAAFIDAAHAAVAARWPSLRAITFGHMGDGNLHYNFSPPRGGEALDLAACEGEVNQVVHDIVARFDGSISAEHGLGVLRRDEAAAYKSPIEIGMMRAIKKALDPQSLLNPGKLLS